MKGNPVECVKQGEMDTPTATSLTLLDRVRHNKPEAWQRLVRLYGPLVYRWCRRVRLREQDAADISQEVFRVVATRIGSFRHDQAGATFRGWLWTISRNKIGDSIRGQERQPSAAGGSDAYRRLAEIPEQLPEDADSTADSCSLVHRALELIRVEFEERTWRAFWQVTVQGMAPKDVAQTLGVTPDAVRMAKSRVLRRLREELIDYADPAN